MGVKLLLEDTIRKKYPESYTDCGENEDEQCSKRYPGATRGSEAWNEVMKLTSAVKWFGKSALKKIREGLDKKTGGQHNGKECNSGYYAEAAASKPTKAAPDITLKGKGYNCKGVARMHPPPLDPPPDHRGCIFCSRHRVPTVPFEAVP